MNKRTPLALAAALAMTVAAGCGSDDDDGGGAAQTAQPSRLAIELSGPPKNPTFAVPDSVKGGVVEIEFTSSVEGEHSAQLVRAEDGHAPSEAIAAAQAWGEKGKPLPDWVAIAGGSGDVREGESVTVTQELPAGRYVVADLASNATAEFEVTGAGGGGQVEAGNAVIEASEYAFESRGLKAGSGDVVFDNVGREPHFVAAIGLRPGSTLAEARRFFETEKGRPPIDESRSFSTAVVDGGIRQSVALDLEPGKYVLLCFVPDREGGPPHVAKGMISEATVAE
jgi:hypothetical protein